MITTPSQCCDTLHTEADLHDPKATKIRVEKHLTTPCLLSIMMAAMLGWLGCVPIPFK